jgi:hypothetical protein
MKTTHALIAAVALATALPSVAIAQESRDLYAGQHILVGDVVIDDDGTTLTVDVQLDGEDWLITESHLFVGDAAPKKAAPGRFPYKASAIDDFSDLYEIDLAELGASSGDVLAVAYHAAVHEIIGWESDLDGLAAALPTSTTDLRVAFPGGDSYFNTTLSGAGDFDGLYDGFCVDTSRGIVPGRWYDAYAVSSYDPAAAALVDFGENLDLVNYVINQGYASQGFTYGEIQRAIWTLVDDVVLTSGLGAWSQANVDAIVAEAFAYGEGFVPGCDDSVAVLLNPVNASDVTSAQVTIAQVTFAEVGVACTPVLGGSETAWAAGDVSFRNGWGSWFDYTVQ